MTDTHKPYSRIIERLFPYTAQCPRTVLWEEQMEWCGEFCGSENFEWHRAEFRFREEKYKILFLLRWS